MLGGRIILGASYRSLYLTFGSALMVLGGLALAALPAGEGAKERMEGRAKSYPQPGDA